MNHSPRRSSSLSGRLLFVSIVVPLIVILPFVVYLMFSEQLSFTGLLVTFTAALAAGIAASIFLSQRLARKADLIQDAVVTLATGSFQSRIVPNGSAVLADAVHAVNKIADGYREKQEFAAQIEAGNLQVSYTPMSEHDLLGHSLLRMKSALAAIKEDDQRRNWAAEGLARFASKLQSANEITALCNEIVVTLCKTLNAVQGSLFIVDDTGQEYLDLMACYAYDRRKFLTKRVTVGEGMIGQAFLEGGTIYLRDIPNDYLRITSGLGGANPRFLLIVPLKTNDHHVGILEIASFNDFEKYRIDFVEKLAENIAHTIINFRTNDNTRRLLAESEKQADLMRQQEESLRQNQEELQATQEEISRKYDELFKQLTELNYASRFDQLQSITATKKRNVEYYFDIIRNQIKTYAANPAIVTAMKDFRHAFHEVSLPRESTLESIRSNVKKYYADEFMPRLNHQSDVHEQIDQYLPSHQRTLVLQHRYISANPFPTGEKYKLDSGGEQRYDEVHKRHHPELRRFLESFGYYDIFLIDHETGNIVYSVFKEVDFGTSLFTDTYSKTNFARAAKAAAESTDPSFVLLADFEPYDPSYRAPASFIACPIYDGVEKAGVLVFQMPVNKINQILTGDNKWEEDGLGESGETILVGADFKLRSNARKLMQQPAAYIQELTERGYSAAVTNQIRKANTSILLEQVPMTAVRKTRAGESGKMIDTSEAGEKMLCVFSPLNIFDVSWMILSMMKEQEVSQTIRLLASKQ